MSLRSSILKEYGGGEKAYGVGEKSYSGGEKPHSGGEKLYARDEKSYGDDEKPYGGSEKSYGGAEKPCRGVEKPYRGVDKPTTGFLTLPYEVRLMIYQFYFVDCFVRCHQTRRFSAYGKVVKVIRCQGPSQHNLLATCSGIYNEGLPLLKSATYIIIDDLDADLALWRMGSSTMSLLLRSLITSTKKLVMSKPADSLSFQPPKGYNRPIFHNLETVEIFGFFPSFMKWFQHNFTISMGWETWYAHIPGWTSATRSTPKRRIQLTDATNWVHEITGRNSKEMKVILNAWESQWANRALNQVGLYHIVVDMDKKTILERQRLQFDQRKDRRYFTLQRDVEDYHHFLEMTEKRRKAWLATVTTEVC